MDIITLSKKTVEILVGSLAKSKGAKQASDEMSSAIWEWVRPIFLKDKSPIQDLKSNPENPLNQQEVEIKILKFINKNIEETAKLNRLINSSMGNIESKGNNIDMKYSNISSKGNINIVGGNQIKK